MRGVYYRTEKDGTPLATPELRISATNNRTVYYDNQNAKEAALQNDEIKEGSIVLTGYADGESEVVIKQEPDWDNADGFTYAQANAGYVVSSDGQIFIRCSGNAATKVTVNGHVIFQHNTSAGFICSVSSVVGKGDIVKYTGPSDTWAGKLVPFKTVAEPLTLPVNVMNNPSLPDYSRAVALTISQFPYTAPSNGVVMMSVNSSSQATGGAGDRKVYVNGTEIANIIASIQGVGARPTDLYIPLSRGDVVSFSNNNADVNIRSGHFIPFKN
jgi:hypothetical protein